MALKDENLLVFGIYGVQVGRNIRALGKKAMRGDADSKEHTSASSAIRSEVISELNLNQVNQQVGAIAEIVQSTVTLERAGAGLVDKDLPNDAGPDGSDNRPILIDLHLVKPS